MPSTQNENDLVVYNRAAWDVQPKKSLPNFFFPSKEKDSYTYPPKSKFFKPKKAFLDRLERTYILPKEKIAILA